MLKINCLSNGHLSGNTLGLFIDAYDWVMVPNVYGMSQHADGGLITTKPYMSSSNYVRKMSDFSEGEWCRIRIQGVMSEQTERVAYAGFLGRRPSG